jgi:hypothetical protein
MLALTKLPASALLVIRPAPMVGHFFGHLGILDRMLVSFPV